MNLHRLQIFCLVVEHQSFTAAAEQLLLTQASVHVQVRALERSLATPLLVRAGRRMRPTEAGEAVYRYAKRMLADASDMATALADLRAARAGHVILGASTSASYLLTPVLARFQAARPAVTVQLRVDQGNVICAQVLKGDFDLGVVVPLTIPKGLAAEILCERRMLLLAPPGHHLAQQGWAEPAALAQEPHVAAPKGTAQREYLERALAQAGIYGLRADLEVGSIGAQKLAILSGAGIGFLPEHTVQVELAARVLQAIPLRGVPPATLPLALVSRPRRALSPLVDEAMVVVRRELADAP